MSSFRNIDAEDSSNQSQQEDVSGFVDTGSVTGEIPRPAAATPTESVRRSRLSSVVDGQNSPAPRSAQMLLGQSENVEQLNPELTVLDEPTQVEPEANKKLFRFFSRK
jgi:hypothetical protein